MSSLHPRARDQGARRAVGLRVSMHTRLRVMRERV
jgi:hypothetical protein